MGLNRPINKTFFLKNGAVKTSGGSNSLVDGQFAVVDLKQGTAEGAAVVSAFAGLPKNDVRLALTTGNVDNGTTRSFSNKSNSSATFALSDIEKLRVSAPTRTAPQKDVVILGYDGFDASKAIQFHPKQAYYNITLKLEGGALQYRGGDVCEEIVNVRIALPKCDPFNDCEECDECAETNCEEIILEAIEQIRRRQLTGGGKVEDFIKVTPILGECDNNPSPSLIDYTFYTLEVCDTGDAEALAAVAAQYDYPVVRINRKGSTSVYQILVPSSEGAPSDLELLTNMVLKGCETCPDGWATISGGLLYAITIADGGADRSAVITAALAPSKVVSGTVTKHGDDNGVGFYTVVYNAPITSNEIASFVGTSTNNRNTATVELVGTTASFCDPDSSEEYSWVAGETCSATSEQFTIVLKDTECNETRLAELQAAYPNLTIAVDTNPNLRTRVLTLSGNDGTANVTVGSTNYLATYGSSLTATAAAFVTSYAATILSAHGVTVTANAGTLIFEGPTAIINALEIANVETNLAGTFEASTQSTPFRVNCSTQYITAVVSNMVCEECSPVFKDFYTTTAPKPFDGAKWKKVETAVNPNGSCLCGIRFEGNIFVLAGDEALRDEVAFQESGVLIQVSAGYTEEIREGTGYFPQTVDHVEHISRFVPRTHLYGNSRAIEAESRSFFQGTNYQPNYVTRVFLAETAAVQDNLAQYISYYVQVNHKEFAGSFGQGYNASAEYEIRTQVGKHVALQNLLNSMAGAAGVPAVTA